MQSSSSTLSAAHSAGILKFFLSKAAAAAPFLKFFLKFFLSKYSPSGATAAAVAEEEDEEEEAEAEEVGEGEVDADAPTRSLQRLPDDYRFAWEQDCDRGARAQRAMCVSPGTSEDFVRLSKRSR